MITRATLDSLPRLLTLRQHFLAVHPRPAAPSTEQAAQAILQGQSIGALVNDQDGYFLAHAGPWQGYASLWIDEVYLRPEVRKRGMLAEIVTWWRGYCHYNGLSLVVGMVFSLEEGKPFRQHLGAVPACTMLQVAVADLEYRPSVLPVLTQTPHTLPELSLPPALAATKPRRSRSARPKVQAEATIIPGGEGSVEQRGIPAGTQPNGVQVQTRHGQVLPLPARPEEM